MEETAMKAAITNRDIDFEASFSNDHQQLIENNNDGIVMGRVKRGLSCWAWRAGCISSCQLQNCATGYCEGGWGGTCVCRRCDNGRN